jgi:cellulose synthase/poly-beta-1,6-N-acetylglucosamine synthase-like glycosyltransferase
VLIAAYNEAAVIAGRIENCLALDYPADRLEIVIASDGSTDGTADVARRYARSGRPGPAVRVLDHPWRRGKPSVLNDGVPRCAGEIVVLGDARQRWDPDAVRRLVENFADASVGAASGELILANAAGAAVGEGVGAYWRYEKAIRRAESAVDATVGATGALYAIRRELFEAIPADTLADDVLIPLRIARRGHRVVFDGSAVARDRVAGSGREEHTRKTRTIAGVVQIFARERWLWWPSHRLWIQVMSHKLLRVAAPLWMATMLVTSAAAAPGRPLYAGLLGAQLCFYGAAVAGALVGRRRGRLARLLALPYAFCLLNLTTVVGIWQLSTGRQSVRWRKAADVRETQAA